MARSANTHRKTKINQNKLNMTNLQSREDRAEHMFNDGYVVLPGLFRVTPALLKKVGERTRSRDAVYVFNDTKELPYHDRRRIQATIQVGEQDIPGFHHVHELLDIPEDIVKTWIVLHSLPGCKAQGAHVDYEIDRVATTDPQVPVSHVCLLALHDGTTMDVWCGAHLHLRKPGDPYKETQEMPVIGRTTVTLSAGDAIAFRADCVHAGSAYSQENTRLQCHLDLPNMPHSENRIKRWKKLFSNVVIAEG